MKGARPTAKAVGWASRGVVDWDTLSHLLAPPRPNATAYSRQGFPALKASMRTAETRTAA